MTGSATRIIEQAQVEARESEVLRRLQALGGASSSEDDLTFEGDKIILPARMTARDGHAFLGRWIESQEAMVQIPRTFKYRPNDGAHALQEVLKATFGTAGIGKTVWSFFGPQRPPLVTIDTNYGETTQVAMGRIAVPQLNNDQGEESFLDVGATHDEKKGLLFSINSYVPKKFKGMIDGIYNSVDAYLRENSIYRGKAINGETTPEFINPFTVDPNDVVYSSDVARQISANVWAPIRHTQQHRDIGISLKRSILLAGTFGTGKTLAAMLTAQECIEHGWTFIWVRPEDDLKQALQTATLYQPAVVFYEDVDAVAGANKDAKGVSALLDMFDGLGSKGHEIMAVLTANEPEKIHRGMMRPGRLDCIIKIEGLDAEAVVTLIKRTMPGRVRDDVDWVKVGTSMEGYMPAFITETTGRAMRYMIDRSEGEPDLLSTEDLVDAANEVRRHYQMMEEAPKTAEANTLNGALADVVANAINNASLVDSDRDVSLKIITTEDAKGAKHYSRVPKETTV